MITKKVDLHSHSIHSDGADTPEQIIERAEKNNIEILALTDHDNIDGSKKLVAIKKSNTLQTSKSITLFFLFRFFSFSIEENRWSH